MLYKSAIDDFLAVQNKYKGGPTSGDDVVRFSIKFSKDLIKVLNCQYIKANHRQLQLYFIPNTLLIVIHFPTPYTFKSTDLKNYCFHKQNYLVINDSQVYFVKKSLNEKWIKIYFT